MLALARKSVSRALDEDARKAALNSPDENVKAAILALSRRRAPSALLFALKAADKAHPDARNVVGEALLDLGLPAAAMTCFETSSTTLRAAIGRATALSELHRPDGEVSAACSEAHGLCRPSDKLELAHLQALSGRYDEAYASALTLSQSFKPGDEGLNALGETIEPRYGNLPALRALCVDEEHVSHAKLKAAANARGLKIGVYAGL